MTDENTAGTDLNSIPWDEATRRAKWLECWSRLLNSLTTDGLNGLYISLAGGELPFIADIEEYEPDPDDPDYGPITADDLGVVENVTVEDYVALNAAFKQCLDLDELHNPDADEDDDYEEVDEDDDDDVELERYKKILDEDEGVEIEDDPSEKAK